MKIRFLNIIFFSFVVMLIVLGVVSFKTFETDILSAFLNRNNESQNLLYKVSGIYSKNVNVVIEGESADAVQEVGYELFESLSETNLNIQDKCFDELIDLYRAYPANFLSEHKRNLLRSKNYNQVSKEGRDGLYNPVGIMIQTPDKDPYLFVTDFVLSLEKYKSNEIVFENGKYYLKLPLFLTSDKTARSDIGTLLRCQNEINNQGVVQVYLTGSPVHSYRTSEKSSFEINVICVLSTLLLFFICKFYFNSYKIILPIVLSILCGFGIGFLATSAVFSNVHILTIVFGTSLIGLSLDYSFHYIVGKTRGIDIDKNLFVSLITTVVAFLLLFFSDIELLKQIGIFTAFGLVGVYCFVKLFYRYFNVFDDVRIREVGFRGVLHKKFVVIVLVLGAVVGCFNLRFSDDLKSLYAPEKDLLKAEMIHSKVFRSDDVSIFSVCADDLNSVLEKEEVVRRYLKDRGIQSISLSVFVPSFTLQSENQTLVKDFYEADLDKYATFLSKSQRLNLKNSFGCPKIEGLGVVDKFLIGKNCTYMLVFDKVVDLKFSGVRRIDFVGEISGILKSIRHNCLGILPLIMLAYFVILSVYFRPRMAVKIIFPPVVGAMFSIGFAGLFAPINLFHILSIFLIFGFSLDYSIFCSSGGKNSKDAVLISFITSFISFMLLSFTSFKLISSMGLVISVGLLISYILSSLLFSCEEIETK